MPTSRSRPPRSWRRRIGLEVAGWGVALAGTFLAWLVLSRGLGYLP